MSRRGAAVQQSFLGARRFEDARVATSLARRQLVPAVGSAVD